MKNQRKNHGKAKENALIPASPGLTEVPGSYADVLQGIKTHIQQSRIKAALLCVFDSAHWQIGQIILTRQTNEGWGAKVIDRLSFDLKEAFPDMRGFSPRNLKYMRTFAEAYPDRTIVQRIVAQIPWKSNLALLDKLKDHDLRLWYGKRLVATCFGVSDRISITSTLGAIEQ